VITVQWFPLIECIFSRRDVVHGLWRMTSVCGKLIDLVQLDPSFVISFVLQAHGAELPGEHRFPEQAVFAAAQVSPWQIAGERNIRRRPCRILGIRGLPIGSFGSVPPCPRCSAAGMNEVGAAPFFSVLSFRSSVH
jgi:hypothetical protein